MLKVKDIFEKEGYTYDKDGRNRTHRSLQNLLDTGFVTFKVCEKKKVWIASDGVKYNISVSVRKPDSKWLTFRIKSQITNIDNFDILKFIGRVLQQESVKSFLKSYVDIDSSCKRCNGQGIIPQFSYYCNGICFDCCGLGHDINFKPTVELKE